MVQERPIAVQWTAWVGVMSELTFLIGALSVDIAELCLKSVLSDPLTHLGRVHPGHPVDTPPRYQGKRLMQAQREGYTLGR